MSHPTVEPAGHMRRASLAQVRPHFGTPSHAPGSHRWSGGRTADKRTADDQTAVLEERARIARELHDSVSQTLYAITLSATRARRLLDRIEHDSEAQRLVDDVLHLADIGQGELRALMTDMRSTAIASQGLNGALTQLAAEVRSRHQLHVRVSLDDEPDLPTAVKDALVPIVREALHNVVKHAHATRVEVVLRADRDGLLLTITDDGRGFDTGAQRPGHFGLQSMRERAADIGATLSVTSERGVGTQIRIHLVAKRST